jgi:hypothetical protein
VAARVPAWGFGAEHAVKQLAFLVLPAAYEALYLGHCSALIRDRWCRWRDLVS